jgi:hypothetical protein
VFIDQMFCLKSRRNYTKNRKNKMAAPMNCMESEKNGVLHAPRGEEWQKNGWHPNIVKLKLVSEGFKNGRLEIATAPCYVWVRSIRPRLCISE